MTDTTDEDKKGKFVKKEIENLFIKILVRTSEEKRESRYNLIMSEFKELEAKVRLLKLQKPHLSEYEAFVEILKNDRN